MKAQDNKENPAGWTTSELEKNWTSFVEVHAKLNNTGLPTERLRYQAEVSSSYNEILDNWSDMSGSLREQTWATLCESLAPAAKEMLAVCVQCGRCCQKGSPTLMEDDIELLKNESIPWNRLVTLRKGEPAHSPITNEVFYLEHEHIKLKERPGTKTCVFFDEKNSECSIHIDRPMQCRAQECWDEEPAKLLIQQSKLNRAILFESVEVLREMIEEHDRRCSFEELRGLFEELKESGGNTAQKVVDFIAFEEHYREFVSEKLNIPEDTLDLVFGRALSTMVRLFGFRVDVDEKGIKTLRPEGSN